MSHLSAEVIINDFEKLKDMFSNMDKNNIWEKFAANDFDFNKTLNSLLEKDKEDGDNYLEASTTSDNKLKRNKSFKIMETLGNIFNKNKSTSTSDSYDYQKLD